MKFKMEALKENKNIMIICLMISGISNDLRFKRIPNQSIFHKYSFECFLFMFRHVGDSPNQWKLLPYTYRYRIYIYSIIINDTGHQMCQYIFQERFIMTLQRKKRIKKNYRLAFPIFFLLFLNWQILQMHEAHRNT